MIGQTSHICIGDGWALHPSLTGLQTDWPYRGASSRVAAYLFTRGRDTLPAKSQAVEAVPDSATRQAIMQAVSELGRDSTQVQDQIMQAILSAETEEELFAILEQSTLDARSRLEVPLRVKTVTLNESGFKDGPPAY